MVSGAVTVQILATNANTISAAIAAVRVTPNDKWMMTSIANGQQVVLAHIEEP